MTFMEYLDNLKAQGISMRQFCRDHDINHTMLSHIRRGVRTDLRLSTMLKLNEATGGQCSRLEDFIYPDGG